MCIRDSGTTCTPGASGTAVTVTGIDDTTIFDDVAAVWNAGDDCGADTDRQSDLLLNGWQGLSVKVASGTNVGNVGIPIDNEESWPFIQVYDYSDGPVEVCYLKAQANECVLLDSVSYTHLTLPTSDLV